MPIAIADHCELRDLAAVCYALPAFISAEVLRRRRRARLAGPEKPKRTSDSKAAPAYPCWRLPEGRVTALPIHRRAHQSPLVSRARAAYALRNCRSLSVSRWANHLRVDRCDEASWTTRRRMMPGYICDRVLPEMLGRSTCETTCSFSHPLCSHGFRAPRPRPVDRALETTLHRRSATRILVLALRGTCRCPDRPSVAAFASVGTSGIMCSRESIQEIGP
jgi:hypothetical protein